jgi:hypothetical protein
MDDEPNSGNRWEPTGSDPTPDRRVRLGANGTGRDS